MFTGSCPCQPYSSAGKRKGNADERDLWPQFARLIRECRPQCVIGEQVSSAVRFGWLDRVHDDLEPEGYTVGACVLTAAGVGAPHLRQRLYWVAHTDGGQSGHGGVQPGGEHGQQPEDGGVARGVAVPIGEQQRGHVGDVASEARPPAEAEHGRCFGDVVERCGTTGAVWDHWRDAIGIDCRDGKRRRVPAQPGVLGVVDGLSADLGRGSVPCAARYPLAGKSPNRAARLRGYGNAICVQTAAAFVRAFLESEGGD